MSEADAHPVRLLMLAVADDVALPDGEDRDMGAQGKGRESTGGALARMLVSSLAFLFQRPIRLFRPMHFSSFSLLELMARREGKKLGIPYLRRLVRHENPALLLALVVPPMMANLAIGFTLFKTYTLTEAWMRGTDTISVGSEPFVPTLVVAVAGAAAGAAQCIISAPLDNIRLVVQPILMHDAARSSSPSALFRMPVRTWTTMVEAAFLPFLPERWYERALQRLQHPRPGQPGSPPAVFRYLPRHVRLLARQKHGVSLALSLVRDASGFACFFIVFEWARRAALYVSLRADQLRQSVRQALPPALRLGSHDAQRDADTNASMDQSFGASRSVLGRCSAAFVLVLGGAIGAWIYSVVSRPIELVRMVLWHRLYVPPRKPRAYSRQASALTNVRAARMPSASARIGLARTTRHLRCDRRRVPPPPRSHIEWRLRAAGPDAGGRLKRPGPVQERLPSTTLARLLRYARMTAPPRLGASPLHLLVHTYLVRPFVFPDLCKPSAPRPSVCRGCGAACSRPTAVASSCLRG
ncbi:hypothetical protein MCAP1_000069 [Malassezia caprae]|uniref:Uncharacterized protein n=1 Tax=Malassezia caprae TaxID=1381934 RepID=A0AAF0IY36_9BASI|nr:hypothetical protein MCAP1_000069 [Malassezia caprae]